MKGIFVDAASRTATAQVLMGRCGLVCDNTLSYDIVLPLQFNRWRRYRARGMTDSKPDWPKILVLSCKSFRTEWRRERDSDYRGPCYYLNLRIISRIISCHSSEPCHDCQGSLAHTGPEGSWPLDGLPALRFPSAHSECPGTSFSSQAILWPRYPQTSLREGATPQCRRTSWPAPGSAVSGPAGWRSSLAYWPLQGVERPPAHL
jgi:hypothetical protein